MASVMVNALVDEFAKGHQNFIKLAADIDPQLYTNVFALPPPPSPQPLRQPAPLSPSTDVLVPPTSYQPSATLHLAVAGTLNVNAELTNDFKIGNALLALLSEKKGFDMIRQFKMRARTLPLNTHIYWGDVCIDSQNPDRGLLVNLGDLIDCGMAFSDIIKSIPGHTYPQLREVLGFNPADLCKSYALFNLSHLSQYYQIDYTHLAVDYTLGIYDYFVSLNLSLPNIARIGITIQIAIEWKDHFASAHRQHQKLLPSQKGSLNSQLARAMENLDRHMLSERFKRRKRNQPNKTPALDNPEEWRAFMELDMDHLRIMGVTRADIDLWWLKPYNLTMQRFMQILEHTSPDTYRYYMTEQPSTDDDAHYRSEFVPSAQKSPNISPVKYEDPQEDKSSSSSSSSSEEEEDTKRISKKKGSHRHHKEESRSHGKRHHQAPRSTQTERVTPAYLDKF